MVVDVLLESERYILGAMMLDAVSDKPVCDYCIKCLGEDAKNYPFLERRHKIIYHAIRGMRFNGAPVDTEGVGSWVRVLGQIDNVGGYYYILELAGCVASTANIDYHLKRVVGHHRKKLMIDAFGLLAEKNDSTSDQLVEAVKKIHEEHGARFNGGGDITMSEAIEIMINQEMSEEGKRCVSTGIETLDVLLNGGLYPGSFTILSGVAAHGKSSLALQIAIEQSKKNKVLYMSAEMPAADIARRAMAHVCGYNVFSDPDSRKFLDASQRIKEMELMMTINDSSVTLADIESAVRREDYSLVVIDYIQRFRVPDQMRIEQMRIISGGLKRLALDCDLPLLALSSVNRSADKSLDMTRLRESGDLEHDADCVMLIQWLREEKKHKLKLDKNRNGRCDTIELSSDMSRFSFAPALSAEQSEWMDGDMPEPPPNYQDKDGIPF